MFRIFLLSLLFLTAAGVYAEDLLYHETLRGDLTDYSISIEDKQGNTEYTLTKSNNTEVHSIERILVDSTGDTREWEYRDFSKNVHISGQRRGRRIELEKRTNRSTITEECFIPDSSPWHQIFPFGMENFIVQGEDEREFWFVQPQNLQLSSMKAVRGEEKVIDRHGIKEQATEVKISINNWLSRFWKGLYLLRSQDGRYLFYEGILRKNLTRGTVELVKERL
ncbi:hypothetical protein [Marispirochaeta sp.]|uniref:hypothetical protein n=1 Tax=Marispirochaeta sp. TaxID=2038653 RepID=UPI0029C8BF5B|nr:hypothetical protein [Marispirochaeta sp.]